MLIIGTERHESRRIDNQLRGRAGRQGDPGRTKFYLALDDDLFRIFGGDRVTKTYESLGIDENMEIQTKLVTSLIESSQKKLEAIHFGARKNTLEYDDVMNIQRTITYEQRRKVIDGEDMHETFLKMLRRVIDNTVSSFCDSDDVSSSDKYSMSLKLSELLGDLPMVMKLKSNDSINMKVSELCDTLYDQSVKALEEKESTVTSEIFREAERVILLQTVDSKWMDHIDNMDQLRLAISMRSVGQHDPVVEYKMESSAMFDEMNDSIQSDAVKFLMRGRFTAESKMETKTAVRQMTEGHGQDLSAAKIPAEAKQNPGATAPTQTAQPVKRDSNKVGRNDMCPCGSGKKYKNCCGKNAEN